MSTAHPLEPGARLGRFEIRSLLGRGGAGAVYRAAGADGGEVAIKVHAPLSGNDAGWRWRLRREFFLLAQLATRTSCLCSTGASTTVSSTT